MRIGIILALLSTLLITACITVSPEPSQSDRNKAIVLEVFDALQSGNLDVLEQYFATDGAVILGLETRERGGPYSTFRDAAAFPGSLTDVTVEVEHVLAEDDKVAIQSLICGNHAETILGFEPTGKQLCSRYINLYVLEDEKIISNSVSVYLDQLTEQLQANQVD